MLATATLILTVTLALPGVESQPAELEIPMPDMETCETKGRAMVALNDETRAFCFVCRRAA